MNTSRLSHCRLPTPACWLIVASTTTADMIVPFPRYERYHWVDRNKWDSQKSRRVRDGNCRCTGQCRLARADWWLKCQAPRVRSIPFVQSSTDVVDMECDKCGDCGATCQHRQWDDCENVWLFDSESNPQGTIHPWPVPDSGVDAAGDGAYNRGKSWNFK